ncbi:MAG TPA: undecaprenyl-phosphate glucose phosphotransferase [Burkholderiales bacterium]|nr:undecaprenyl-phosphate glucose phosphotransferase [Burkholderiales bacterium]
MPTRTGEAKSDAGPEAERIADEEDRQRTQALWFRRGLLRQFYPLISELWQLLDAAAVGIALYAVTRIRGGTFGEQHVLLIAVTAVLILAVYSWSDLFYRLRTRSLLQEAVRLLQAWAIVLTLLMATAYLAQLHPYFSPRFVLLWGATGYLAQLVLHVAIRKTMHFLRRRGYNVRVAIVVGCGAPLERHLHLVERNPWLGIEIAGFVAEPGWLAAEGGVGHVKPERRYLGGLSDIERLVDILKVSEIYVALPLERSADAERALRALVNVPVNVNWLPDFSVAQVLSMRSDELDGQPIVLLSDSRIERHGRLVKRIEDVVMAGALIVLLAPLLFFIALAVKHSSPGSVLFKQLRHGAGGQRFHVWKFRTMRIDVDSGRAKQATAHDNRVTPIGRVLRRWSLDELPQLFNVLAGTMSLVGPRPHPVWLNDSYAQTIDRYMQRHRVKPGLTGWAQVNGFRGETATREKMEQRVNCDLYYINHWSPWLDVKILARTIIAVLNKNNAY